MPNKKPKSSKQDELQSFFDSISPCKLGRNNYAKIDRYRDFQAVFGTDAGKRVLSQIQDVCEGKPILIHEASDLGQLSYRSGQRYPILWIMATMFNQPPEVK